MIVFELPAHHHGEGLRAAAIGSCRVVNPISVLAERGDLKICASGLQATHSAAEALQIVRFIGGEIEIPDKLSPYIFDAERTPSPLPLERTVAGGVDAVIVEISDDRNFFYRDIALQQNFFSINLVRPGGVALLPWFRDLCADRPIDEACVQSALDQLKKAGHRHDDAMAELLRNIRQERQSEEEITRQLASMMSKWGGRWIVVGTFDVPGHDGAVMRHRRTLNERLNNAARQCGAAFFDPSKLVAEHGKATALDGGGADIHEYAPAFYSTVGETLVDLLRPEGPLVRGRPAACAPPAAAETSRSEYLARSRLAKTVNRELIELHRGRLASLGVSVSGLGPHYKAVIERETLVGVRELGALELISTYLPTYDAYAVLRAGLGELALLIAASGRTAIAYEPYATRRAAIEAGRAHLEAIDLIAPGLLTISPA